MSIVIYISDGGYSLIKTILDIIIELYYWFYHLLATSAGQQANEKEAKIYAISANTDEKKLSALNPAQIYHMKEHPPLPAWRSMRIIEIDGTRIRDKEDNSPGLNQVRKQVDFQPGQTR